MKQITASVWLCRHFDFLNQVLDHTGFSTGKGYQNPQCFLFEKVELLSIISSAEYFEQYLSQFRVHQDVESLLLLCLIRQFDAILGD